MTRAITFSSRLSDEATALLSELRKPQSFRLFGNVRLELDVLDRLARLREPRLIADLLGYVFDGSREIQERVAQILTQLLREIPPEKLHWLDESLRPGYFAWSPPKWFRMKPPQLRQLLTFGDAANTLIALASSHHSGFVRQAA